MDLDARVIRWLIGVSLGMGLLAVINQLQIPFYLYYPRTAHTVLISDSFDLYFFLLSTCCVPATLAFSSRKLSRSGPLGILLIWITGLLITIAGQPFGAVILYVTVVFAAVLNVSKADLRREAAREVLLCPFALLVLIEYATLYYWIGSAFNPGGQAGLLTEQLETDLTFSLFPLAILMMLLLLFSWLWIPIITRYLRQRNYPVSGNDPVILDRNLRLVVASLDLFLILTIMIFSYLYLAGQPWIVGVDSYIRYLIPLNDIIGLAPSEALAKSYSIHGFYVFLLYLIQRATGASSFSIVKFAPLFLTFTTAAAVFLTIIRGGWSVRLAILSSVCVLLWLPTTLGTYTGIQANWLAFLLWMLFLSFYFTSREWDTFAFVLQGLISLAIFLIHPWTWGVFLASLVLTTIISSGSNDRKRCVQGLLAALMLVMPLGIAAYLFLPSFSYDLTHTLTLYTFNTVHPYSLLSFEGALTELFSKWSSFFSPLLLLLSLIGAYHFSRFEGVMRKYLLAWIAVWCVGSIMVAPIGYSVNFSVSESELWRMMYISPLPFLLALGLEKCLDLSKRLDIFGEDNPISRQSWMLVSGVCIALSGGLFVFSNPILRLALVLVGLSSLLLFARRFPKYQLTRILLISLLVLIVFNAACRSLYPLLLDPHNLFGTFSGSR